MHAVIVELVKCAQPWTCVCVCVCECHKSSRDTYCSSHFLYSVFNGLFLLQGSSRLALSNQNLLKPKHKGFPWVGSEKDLKTVSAH